MVLPMCSMNMPKTYFDTGGLICCVSIVAVMPPAGADSETAPGPLRMKASTPLWQ